MELDVWSSEYSQRIKRSSTQSIFAVVGLAGILTLMFLLLMISYWLSYEVHGAVFFVHVQNTVCMFLLATSFIVIVLKISFSLKRLIWWVWGTQTPNFDPPEHESIDSDLETITEARCKGVRWITIGLFLAYLVPLSGLYIEPFLESTFVTNYPEIPFLPDIIQFIAELPLFSESEFVTLFLTVVDPVQVVVLGIVLSLLTLGLWNLTYVFSRNYLFREQVLENPAQTASLYYISIIFGIIGIGFSVWIAQL